VVVVVVVMVVVVVVVVAAAAAVVLAAAVVFCSAALALCVCVGEHASHCCLCRFALSCVCLALLPARRCWHTRRCSRSRR
jgi:hypothetical protein